MEKFKTFEEWFFSVPDGSFAMTAEYFYDDVGSTNDKERLARIMQLWLAAAFEAGKETK